MTNDPAAKSIKTRRKSLNLYHYMNLSRILCRLYYNERACRRTVLQACQICYHDMHTSYVLYKFSVTTILHHKLTRRFK